MRIGDLTLETLAIALVVGLIAGLVGLSLRYGLQTWLDEFMSLIRELFGWARGRALQPRVTAQPWFCMDCHSQNLAAAKFCYRGCGPREEHEDFDPLGVHPPASARAGTARRRG